jgi:hypothetical protein
MHHLPIATRHSQGPGGAVCPVASTEVYPESPVAFENRDDRFPDFGINVHVVEPGQPNA